MATQKLTKEEQQKYYQLNAQLKFYQEREAKKETQRVHDLAHDFSFYRDKCSIYQKENYNLEYQLGWFKFALFCLSFASIAGGFIYIGWSLAR